MHHLCLLLYQGRLQSTHKAFLGEVSDGDQKRAETVM